MLLASVEDVFSELAAAASAAGSPADRVRAFARAENAACAARLSAMADMLAAAHAADGSADRDQWRIDNWAAVCAQIGAAHEVTTGIANSLLTDAVILRDRLPKLAAVFACGTIAYRLVHQICVRTGLVTDPDAVDALDKALADLVTTRGAMSRDQAEKAIDALVLALDPFAVRRTQAASRGHHADLYVDDASGTARLEAELSVTDGHAIDLRALALANTVCRPDPRTLDQRRAAALGAMGFGWDRLPCLCESPDCDANSTPPVGGIVIHVIARQDTLEDTDDPYGPDDDDGGGGGDLAPEPEPPSDEIESDVTTVESDSITVDPAPDPAAPVGHLSAQRRGLVGPPPPLVPKPWYTYTWPNLLAELNSDPGEHCPASPGVILGGGVVPAPVVAQAARHATIRPLIHPGDAPPEPRYRPSRALAEFVRCRDQTCRAPGCTKPATQCDIDHVIPYPCGPTAASNLVCLCRFHHLVKTFWPGWSSRQLPDATLVWTDPDGHTYTTYPGSRLLFPELCERTAEVTARGTPPSKHTAGLTMPRRDTTRDEDRRQRVAYERRHNLPVVLQHLKDTIPPF